MEDQGRNGNTEIIRVPETDGDEMERTHYSSNKKDKFSGKKFRLKLKRPTDFCFQP